MHHTFFPPQELAGEGFIELPMKGEIEWLPGHDKELFDYVETQGRPFILVGRNSTVSGSAGYRAAATDLHQAAEVLAVLSGMEVRHLLPDIDELTTMLRTKASAETHTSQEGKRFVNKFVIVHVAGTRLVLSLSVGTGAKVSEELEQPHTARLERYVREFTPPVAGIFAKRTDRYCRTVHGHTKLYDRLAQLHRAMGVWSGDGAVGRWEFDKPHTSMVLAMLASFGATEAEVLAAKALSAKRRLTGEQMEGGRVMMASASHAPAGTMYYRDVADGRLYLAIDTPSNYPAPHEASGLPQVRDIFGLPADQVALVRRLLAMWGVDDSDPVHLFYDLCRDGLSSQRLRERNGLDCAFLSDRHVRHIKDSHVAASWAKAIRTNLEFYETGVLRVNLGEEVREIGNCFPPDGPWATPEDFARIRTFETRRQDRAALSRKNRWSGSGWQGLPVSLDGEEAHLRATARIGASAHRRGAGVDWHVDREGRRLREHSPVVPDEELRVSILEALRSHDGMVLERFAMDRTSVEVADLKRRNTVVLGELSDLESSRSKMVDHIMSMSGLSDELVGELARRDADMAREEAALRSEQRTIDVRLAILRQHVGANQSDLDKIVAFLKGHHEPGIADAWRRAIQNLAFVRAPGSRWDRPISWSGELVIDDERTHRNLWTLPFSGTFTPRALAESEGVVALLGLLREGEVVRGASGLLAARKKELAELAGVKQASMRAMACNEPQLVRLWMAVQFPHPLAGEDPAGVVSVEQLLAEESFTAFFGGLDSARKVVDRVRALAAGNDEGGWLRPATRLGTEFVIRNASIQAGAAARDRAAGSTHAQAAARLRDVARKAGQLHRWTFSPMKWPALTPCAFCDGIWCVPTRIQEIAGYLCLNPACRRDEAGVRWPARFDQYISGADLLLEAGIALSVGRDFNGRSRRLRSRNVTGGDLLARRCRVEELSDTQRQDLLDSYKNGEEVRSLFDRLRLRYDDAYAYLTAQGMPRRVRRRESREAGPAQGMGKPHAS